MSYLASKPRYEILDGLRGVAAIIVVAFHLFETYSAGPDEQILNHGYLAVDFFFVLSGFVIGYAYDDRWNRMSLKDFFKRRLVRLHPMLIMGTLTGTALFYHTCGGVSALVMQTEWWKLLLMTLLGCALLPAIKAWDIRGLGEMYPINGPMWSLFWEYIANILYGTLIRRFSTALLAIFVAFAALLTLDLTLNTDIFGLLEGRAYAANTVIGGWSLDTEQCYIGISRLLYPFFAGLLLSRVGKTISLRGGFWWCSLLVAILLCMPFIPGGEKGAWTSLNGIYNAFCILIMFPLIVSTGAGSRVTDRRSVAVCKFLGEISYPLYVTHYPLIYIQMRWAAEHPEATTGQQVMEASGIFILSIAVAYAALRLYDEPVREWLKQRFLLKRG